jgi:hypothetical protein
MKCRTLVVACLAWWIAVTALAQTIQLPSIHTFSVDTTVVVPDSGTGFIAGGKQARTSSSQFGGLPAGRAIGVDRQGAGMAVTAKIHDPEAADAALLNEAQARRARTDAAPARKTGAGLALAPDDPGLHSVAELRRRQGAAAPGNQRETLEFIERARRASTAGKSAIADSYYRSASRQATGPLKQQIDAEWRRLDAAGNEHAKAAPDSRPRSQAPHSPASPRPRGVEF